MATRKKTNASASLPHGFDGDAPPKDVDSRYYVQAAGRTVKLLVVMAAQPGPVTLQRLVELVGPNKPVVYRLLRTLEAHGAVRRLPDGGYALGPTLMSIANSAQHSVEIARVARSHMEELTRTVEEDTTLAILHWDQIVVLERVIAYQHYLGLRSTIGSRMPAHCTSMGHVLLAGLPDDEVLHRLRSRPMDDAGPNASATPEQALESVRLARRRGWALNDQQLVAGHRSVGAPIRDHRDEVVAAINVSVPSVRATLEDMRTRFVPPLLEAAEAIATDLGRPPTQAKQD